VGTIRRLLPKRRLGPVVRVADHPEIIRKHVAVREDLFLHISLPGIFRAHEELSDGRG
jgi:hypothetical protein